MSINEKINKGITLIVYLFKKLYELNLLGYETNGVTNSAKCQIGLQGTNKYNKTKYKATKSVVQVILPV